MTDEIFRPDFLIIPFQLYTEGIRAQDRDVYGLVYWYERLKDGVCKAGNETIAKVLNTTPGSVQNSLLRLERAGFIEREYYDEARKLRKCIKTLVAYQKREKSKSEVPPTGDTVPPTGGTRYHPQVTRESNSNRVIDKKRGSVAKAPPLSSPEKRKERSLSYLENFSDEEAKEIAEKYETSEEFVKRKAEDLFLYCQSKGKKYKNYRAFLLGAVRKDAPKKGDQGILSTTAIDDFTY